MLDLWLSLYGGAQVTTWTEEDIAKLRIKGRSEPLGASAKKRGKYRAEPTEVDGHKFPSRREAARYEHLKLLQTAGDIGDLELQPQYPLIVTTPAGVKVMVGVYTADFRYMRKGGGIVVEDAKGFKSNEAYRLRKRLVEAIYGIAIEEV